MRHTLRRILWIVPTLLLVSLFSFAALSRSDAGALPRFFQPSPQSVRDLALGAMARVAEGDRQAHAELARLGGAALPFVLPALDGLAPAGRARVAVALAPVARRMGVGGGEALERPETAVLFWTRFWQDRGIDFRPAVVKRAVKRLGMRSTVGRRDDVLQLDTYALSELVGAMGDVRSEDDVSRVRRLAAAAAHVTGMALRVERDASIADAERVAAEWRRWWRKHKSEYSTLDGPSRIVAMFSQTQYGRWAVGAADERLGLTESGEPVLDLLEARAPVSLWLVFWALVAGYLGGIAVGLAGAVRAHRPLDLSTTAATLLVVAVPTATVATLLAPADIRRPGTGGAIALMVLLSLALVSRYQRAASRTALDQEYVRTLRAQGASDARVALRVFRASSAAVLSLSGVQLPTLLTAAFVLEQAFRLPGLGPVTLQAAAVRDVPWLMAMALGGTAFVALAQIGSDLLLARLDPRVRVAIHRQGAALE
ncbi:MAG: ABC transporter permease [Myxococcales bacterium]|nr:ABC transporter permease [Myxococcales bacterium]MCB9577795.1 ABC transporter permease [Polyangiaceae bacterium]